MLDINMFNTEDECAWCPGCGDFGILAALKQALLELELKPHQVVIASGIGQAAKTPHYIKVNGFNGLHGRAVPPAVGIKLANKDLKVIIDSGDGDTYGEGGNHLLHNIRKNVDITHFIHDNQIYGLTKGQASPTTALGQKTSMQFEGTKVDQFMPLAFAISIGCTFVARSFSGDKDHLVSIMKEAIMHKGYSLVDILQPCVTFNHVNTFKWYKERTYRLDDSYDYTNKFEAMKKAMEYGDEGIPMGIIYKEDKIDFIERIPQLSQGGALVDRQWSPKNAERYMLDFQ